MSVCGGEGECGGSRFTSRWVNYFGIEGFDYKTNWRPPHCILQTKHPSLGPMPQEIRKWALGHLIEKLKKIQNKIDLMGCKWSSLNAPGTEIPFSHWLEDFLISLGGYIENGLWGMKKISWKNFTTKLARWAANGPVWMPQQALKSLCLTLVGRIPFSHFPRAIKTVLSK